MMTYIPEELYNNISNKHKVEKILASVEETCLITPGIKTVEDARREIQELGEAKVAEAIIVG